MLDWLQSHWTLAMAALIPVMARGPKMRTWGSMLGASAAAWLVPYAHAPSYLAIDLLAGGIVLVRPAGLPQRMIGALFASMSMFHIGVLLAGGPGDIGLYMGANLAAGWLQWAILLCWGVYDAVRPIVDRYRPDRRAPAAAGGD